MYRAIYLASMVLLIAVLTAFTTSTASAHGHVTVGDYELVIGFRNEPAYQGEPNGLDLRVINKKTDEPVKDLAGTLKAELVFGSSKRSLELRPQWGEEGSYTADVLPTEAGAYTWHIFGEIEGTPVDISMTAGQGTFSEIEAKGEVSFPAAEPTAVELRAQAAAAAEMAQTALIVGIVGTVLGVIGTVVGLLGMRARRSSEVGAVQAQRALP